MKDQPLSFVGGLFHKSVELFSSREAPGNIDIYLLAKWSGLLKCLIWKVGRFGFPFGILLPLAVSGLVMNFRKVPIPIFLFIVLYPATIVVTHVEARYRIPLVIPMCLLAGAGIVEIARLYREREKTRLTIAVICIAAIAAASSMAGPFSGEKIDYESELYFALGDSLNKHNKPQEAIAAYKRSISLNEDNYNAHGNLGKLLNETGDSQAALPHLQKVLRAYPDAAASYYSVGRSLLALGKTDQAIDHFDEAISHDPGHADSYNQKGEALFWKKQLDQALANFQKAVELKPYEADYHNNIGNIYAMGKNHEAALEHYGTVLELNPDHAMAYSNRGNVFFAMRRYKEAEKDYRQSLAIAPNLVRTHYNLALCLQKLGLKQQAIEELKTTINIDPSHDRARQKLYELSN